MAAEKAKPPSAAKSEPASRPDLATMGGLLLAAVGLIGGLLLEGGELKDITQITAAIIVLGGTFGAVMVNFPLGVLKGALRRLLDVFFEKSLTPETMIEQIAGFATRARKQGIVSLEQDADSIQDKFLRKALTLAVDGTDLQELRKMMELEINNTEHRAEQEAKVWESAGGYSPTIGIIGAVMGLIQVMKNLADIEKVGHGIAVAFVATVYGVAFANVLFLPIGNKIKLRAHRESQMKELILEGVVGIVEGLNPKLIRAKLEAFVHTEPPKPVKKPAAPPAQKAA
jgi:chemotaxis protein MotA